MVEADKFPEITIEGEPYQRGRQHGEQLKTEVAETVEFYRSIFGLPESEIVRLAAHFQSQIQQFNAEYIDEITGIAEGADIDPLWVVALNARTEILTHKDVSASNECTSVYFPQQSILAQNWDWGRALEPLTVLMKIIKPCGHTIRMVTEPGIIGKIGMNSAGIGVCLNILTLGQELDGLPVHIVLRALLDCRSFDSAKSLLQEQGKGKASNIIVADEDGNGVDIEFCGDRFFLLEPEEDFLLHTNHYLGEAINSPHCADFASSYARFDKAKTLLESNKERSVAQLCRLLSDESDSELPIYRQYVADDSVHELGTVCSIVMSLAQQKMFIRKGKSEGARFIEYGLN
jgi:isopenicillin-N N-acyltransferase-like protein